MKVLIYAFESELAPKGGPLGYLFNLKKAVDANNDDSITFIKDDFKYKKVKQKINGIKNVWLRKVLVQFKLLAKYWLLLYGKKHTSQVDLSKFDIVHFHSTFDMYSVRDSLVNYQGKVVLTSHSPTLLSKEIYDSASKFCKCFRFIYGKLSLMDTYAFSRADYYIFPCSEAEEPYYHAWQDFYVLKEKRKNQFKYLLTGIPPCHSKISPVEVRKKYNIPNDCFVFCYVGRHNEIKGYDVLKRLGEKILSEYKNAYFLVAGKEEPMKGIKSNRWIEVGWTSDPYSLISASDVFLLPNKETYFDLILLEVLSLGKIVIASNTGGNKHFRNSESIFLYDDTMEAYGLMKMIYSTSIEERTRLENLSFSEYKKYYTCNSFYVNYKNIMLDIFNSKQ